VRVIAIDGPAGSGKSTVARLLAERLDLAYLDTGAMYRAVAFAAIHHGVDPTEVDPVAVLARSIELDVSSAGVVVDGMDATVEIRGPEVSRAVSHVAANPGVRTELRGRQRAWAEGRGGGVIEGRDIGSVVFPEAILKVYLTADPEVRAQRRAAEMGDVDAVRIAADIERRDAMDKNREHSPLVTPDGAVTVDTTGLGIADVVDLLASMVGERS
jgi:CMP/dCMP kinase